LAELKGNHDLLHDTITSRYTVKNKERKINEDPCTDLRILPSTSRRRKGKKLLHTVKYFSSLSICLLVTA